MVYLLRRIAYNFISKHRERSINGLKLSELPFVDENEEITDLDNYLASVVLTMGHDAEGVMLYLVPIVLRINVNIINVD